LGIFAEVEDRRFELTPQATHLQENAPGSLCLPALFAGATWCWQSRGELLYSVRTGKPAFERIFGMSIFDYFAQDAEAAETFHNAMSTSAGAVSTVVLNACDFSGVDRLVDVGGGSGKLIAAIMKANPRLRGVLFDVPSAIEDARDFVAGEGVADRCEFVAGDFFDGPIPSGDVHVLSRVIHDWDDDCAVTILENCRRGMPDDGRLLIVESVIPPGNAPSPAKLRDLDMLVMWGGRERTEEEFRALFDASGFKLTDVVLRHFPISVVEGVPT
jgi:ubiquinone/menaquinone biosynthesis C-methylase UbiE